jgi:virulence factor Mce-like protein
MNARLPTRTRRRRRETESALRGSLWGLGVAVVLGIAGYFAISSYSGVPGRDYETFYATAPSAANLLQHDPVRIAGVRVGQVLGRTTTSSGGARIELQLDPDTQLPADTKVKVRANGLLGARYVQLIPGTSHDMLANGATIRGARNAVTFGLPETLDAFDPRTRAALAGMVGGLGEGLLTHGNDLNEAVHLSSTNMPGFQKLIADVLERPGAARRLLPALDSAVAPLNASRDDIANGIVPLDVALAPFVDRRDAVQRTLAEAPSTLAAADSGLTRGRTLLGAARSLATEASVTLPTAPAGLRTTAALLREARTPLVRTNTLLKAAEPAVPGALRITKALKPILDPTRAALDNLTPMVNQIAPYGCDIRNLGVTFRSMTGFGGVGEGPGGSAMQFRLQAISPLPTEAAGVTDNTGLLIRDGYPEPCKYLGGTYPSPDIRGLTGARK